MPNRKGSMCIDPEQVKKKLSDDESKKVVVQWMKIFCKNKQGYNTKDFKWHIFSGGGYPSVAEDEALEEYSSQVCAEYYVMDNDSEKVVVTDERPMKLGYRDYYVFPENMAWTMAFTHEDGWLGPYFAKHEQWKKLAIENKAKLEKLRRKEQAKKKGWH